MEPNDQIEGHSECVTKMLIEKLADERNYVFYGCVEHKIRKCLKVVQKNVQELEE